MREVSSFARPALLGEIGGGLAEFAGADDNNQVWSIAA